MWMNILKAVGFVVLSFLLSGISLAQQVSLPDERSKADILLVVAHPDDDTLVTSYLARAIFDRHKRIAVVYCTRGDSGGNAEAREHTRALGLVREIEGRRAMSFLGITNVWFLDGRDTASQDVRLSLGTWPTGAVLEQMVRIFRLTRPEAVITWLPSSVAGENHGDHQASGVIATQAFDIAGDPAIFPAQLAAPMRQFENAFDGLSPWQAKKLYYFTDAFDTTFMQGRGPEYSGKEVSASRKVSYLQLAIQSAGAYYTQSPDPKINRQIEAGQNLDAIVGQLQASGAFPDPVRLLLAKSHVKSAAIADVFDGVQPGEIGFRPSKGHAAENSSGLQIELAGPWGFYRDFWRDHDLQSLEFRRPEMAVQPNDTLTIPLLVRNNSTETKQMTASVVLPPGWKQKGPNPEVAVPPGGQATISLPVIAADQETKTFAEIKIDAQSGEKSVFHESMYVEVSPYVASQLK
jgi:LmbE family N-acetylglucosaminyl deacetylase